MGIQNPHDKFFKETFGRVEVARDFFSNYLPQNVLNIIDLDTIEPQKGSFINGELEESFSDLLFKVNINDTEGYIYFLFEHKSYPARDIVFQLLKYMIEIWETKIKKEELNKLPVIIPLVIYHGTENWKINTTLGEMIRGYDKFPEDIKKYIPDYEYILYDISRFTDEQIKGQAIEKAALTIMRDIRTRDVSRITNSLLMAAKYLAELSDKQTGMEYFETMVRYIFNVRGDIGPKDIETMAVKIENTYPEGSDIMMTLAEKLKEEGREKGLKEGLEKGKRDERLSTAIKLLTKKFGPLPKELKSKIAKLDSVTLEIIIDGIFDYESLEDVKKYIN
jgi:predicted transposase/invertase (TIGR01784 family)